MIVDNNGYLHFFAQGDAIGTISRLESFDQKSARVSIILPSPKGGFEELRKRFDRDDHFINFHPLSSYCLNK